MEVLTTRAVHNATTAKSWLHREISRETHA